MEYVQAHRVTLSALRRNDSHINAKIYFSVGEDEHFENVTIHPYKLVRNAMVRAIVDGNLYEVTLSNGVIVRILNKYHDTIESLAKRLKTSLSSYASVIEKSDRYMSNLTADDRDRLHEYHQGIGINLSYHDDTVDWSKVKPSCSRNFSKFLTPRIGASSIDEVKTFENLQFDDSCVNMNHHFKDMIRIIHNAPRCKQTLRVFRGLTYRPKGDILKMPYLMATTLLRPVAVFFSDHNTILDITVPKNTPSLFVMEESNGVNHPVDQFEVLLPPCIMKVVSEVMWDSLDWMKSVGHDEFSKYFFDDDDEGEGSILVIKVELHVVQNLEITENGVKIG